MSKFYFYTETAFHHQGDISFLKGLIDASSRSGAQGVKFQVLTEPSDFLSTRHSGFSALSSYCLTYDQWKEIFQYTRGQGLDLILMPLDLRAIELAKEFPVTFIDIHPVSFHDTPLLNEIKKTGVPIILGVGGRTLEEITLAIENFKHQLQVLMVGFQAFPSELKDVKLSRIQKLKKLFPNHKIGYADHSSYRHEHAVVSNEYAYLLGAEVFEKHITTQEGIDRVDYSAAVSEEKIKQIVERISFLENSVMGTEDGSVFDFSPPEVKYRERQKKVVLREDLTAGSTLSDKNLTTKMIDKEGGFFKVEELIGRKLAVAVEQDVLLENNHLIS